MNFNFPLFLVLASAITGFIWLADAWLFAPKRRAAAQGAGGPGHIVEEPHDPVLVEYAKSFFPIIFVVLLLRSFLVEPFRIPSGSMMPTLLIGDFILVNKFAYGLRLPVLNTRFLEIGQPQRGDVFVFRYPLEPSIDYIKRVVGVPGDEIYYHHKQLYVNGVPMALEDRGVYQGEGAAARQAYSMRFEENLTQVEHDVLVVPMTPDYPSGCQVLARGPVVVPPGHYFAMGDNRDNSNDSRCWGLVPEANLVGKAFAIWMNWDGERQGFPIQWERIGRAIH